MSTDPEKLQALYQVAFNESEGVSPEIFKDFGRTFQDGERLCTECEEGAELFIILSGEVKISKQIGGKETELAVLGKDMIFGEMAIFDNQPRSATAVAKGTVETLVFNKDNFEVIFQLHPKWTMKLIDGMGSRILNVFKEIDSKLK